jgi:hypothetical protein
MAQGVGWVGAMVWSLRTDHVSLEPKTQEMQKRFDILSGRHNKPRNGRHSYPRI